MARNTPKPWRYESVGKCGSTGEEFGNIIAANGVEVAADVYRSDAEAIIAPPEVERVVLATEKGLTPFGECIAALEDFVRAEDDWLREKGGIGEDKFDDPLSDAYKRAKRALSAFGPQGER